MNKHLMWLIFILVGVMMIGGFLKQAQAQVIQYKEGNAQGLSSLLSAPTETPTKSPTHVVKATPESRALPPVGRNAGLVIGASVLVLIIISGVLGARRRDKH